MITEPIRSLIEHIPYVFVATSDRSGQAHLAIGEQVAVTGDSTLTFENWFCPSTLQNISGNAHASVVAVDPGTGRGYQMLGSVIYHGNATILDGYDPVVHQPETPQVLTRFTVRVEKVFEFTSGIHSDLSIV